MSSASLVGTLSPDDDRVTLEAPAGDRFFGENHALWLWDPVRGAGLRTQIRTLGQVTSFAHRRETIYVFLPDGVVLVSDQDGPGPTTDSVVKGPNLMGECIEPFGRWRFAYDCTARATTAQEMREDLLRVEPPESLAFEVEITMAGQPWVLGSYSHGSSLEWARTFFGGKRYEQLVTAEGVIRARGRELPLSGAGLRTHRVGRRDTSSFPGHAWLSGLFDDGRSFGLQRFCGSDGVAQWEEAWVGQGDQRHPATALAVPLYSQEIPGETYVVELESILGHSVISGTLQATNFVTSKQPDPQKLCPGLDCRDPRNRVMSQGLATYRWDGVSGIGMIERSIHCGERAPTLPS